MRSRRTDLVLIAVLMTTLSITLSIMEAVGLEPPAKKGSPPWASPLGAVDAALAAKDVDGAMRALRQAHAAALASRRWDALIAVGDVALRVDKASSSRAAALPLARQAYLSALFRARAEGSLDGVLRVTEAFVALGDRQVAAQALQIARALAARSNDARAIARVRALEGRLFEGDLTAGELRVE